MMRLILSLASVLLTSSAVLAQAPAAAGGPTRDPAPFVATGCIAVAVQDGSLAGSPGVPPANPNTAPVLANSSEPTGAFVLNGATPPAGSRREAGASNNERATHTYALDGDARQFQAHVGHRVEVTGQLAHARTGSAPGPSTPVDHIRVAAVKMISGECPQPASRK